MTQTAATRPSPGFTLIELMIVVVIATILLSIAVPSYMSQVRQSRRTEAKTAVLDLAGREERYFSTNGALYSITPTDLGYLGAAFPALVGPDNYYTLTVCSPASAANCDPNANPPAAPSYYITATAAAGTSQAADAQCQSFSVDSTGQQFSTGTLTSQQCWSQ
jgi:type IV pilus assembly protein PilE